MLHTIASQFLNPCFIGLIASVAMQAAIVVVFILIVAIQGILALAIHLSASKLQGRHIELRLLKRPKTWAALTFIFGILVVLSYCLLHKHYFEDQDTNTD